LKNYVDCISRFECGATTGSDFAIISRFRLHGIQIRPNIKPNYAPLLVLSLSISGRTLLVIEPVLAAVVFDLMERSSNSMENTSGYVLAWEFLSKGIMTYVLIIARTNVPQGRLHVSSLDAVVPVTSSVAPLFKRLGL
jgi:hypothetical protein